MSNFPSLQPALTFEISLGMPAQIGMVSNGAPVTCLTVTAGKMEGVDGGPLANLLNAECINGYDVSRADPSFQHTRLEVNSAWRNNDGSMIFVSYKTLLQITEMTRRIFMGDPEAISTEYGHMFTVIKFETSDPKLKILEENVFVGSGRMVVEAGKPLRAEYQVSIVGK